jgi:hypothetical protein
MPIIKDWSVYTGGTQGEAYRPSGTMFGESHSDLKRCMSQMWEDAHNRSCANKVEAAKSVQSWVSHDPRFGQYDPEKLVDRFQHCLGSAAKLDFNDPALLKGGQPRPCQLRGSRY